MKLFILFFSLIVWIQPKDSVYALIRNEAIGAGIDKTFLDKTFNHKDIRFTLKSRNYLKNLMKKRVGQNTEKYSLQKKGWTREQNSTPKNPTC